MCQVEWIRAKLFESPMTFNEGRRFLSKVARKGSCWEWTGAKSAGKRKGINSIYGSFSFRGKTVRAHTFAFAAFAVWHKLKDGQQVDHMCGNPLCVNPDHLRPLCKFENMRLGSLKRHKKNDKQFN